MQIRLELKSHSMFESWCNIVIKPDIGSSTTATGISLKWGPVRITKHLFWTLEIQPEHDVLLKGQWLEPSKFRKMTSTSLLDSQKRKLVYMRPTKMPVLIRDIQWSLPKTSREDFELIFSELDHSGDFKINLEEFTDLCNAIALKFQKEPSPSCFEKYPSFYHSPPCEKLKAFVRSNLFEYIIVSILILNLVAVIIETTLDIENSSAQKLWQKVEFFFGWIYVLEVALKIFSVGFDAYWMEGQNRFDFVITWIIVIGETMTFFFPSGLPFLSNGEWIRYLLLGRMLRLIRLLLQVQSYKAFVATFLTLIPSLMPYLGIIFCVLCVYCSLGLQLFGGIVNAGNPKLETTDLFNNDYVLFNFNDYPNGMVTLFNLVVMGNWHIWMQSYRDLTGTSWTLAYFISFYLVTVLLLLNLIVAFVLEAFFTEMELENPVVMKKTRKLLKERTGHGMLV
uniref:EF-hand domain-containing protein n=1 Tax=Ananas comosus var. bracteatus TaxID=296719 RepID=A0A6V7PUA5_ANACO|nr:unnamed protein product [Ananas comosus var. bracteatus]